MRALGAAIRDQRKLLGLTQEELADRMAALGDENIRQSDISRFENGQVQFPRFERLNYLTEALEITLGDLLIHAGWTSGESVAAVTEKSAAHDDPTTREQPPAAAYPPEQQPDEAEASEPPTTPHQRLEQSRAQLEQALLLYQEALAEYERRVGGKPPLSGA